MSRLDVFLVLAVLLLTESLELVTLFFGLGQSLAQALHFLLKVLDAQGQLQLSLGQALSQIAYNCLTLLNLAHIRLGQRLDFVLVSGVELIDLRLGLLLSDDRLAGVVLE